MKKIVLNFYYSEEEEGKKGRLSILSVDKDGNPESQSFSTKKKDNIIKELKNFVSNL